MTRSAYSQGKWHKSGPQLSAGYVYRLNSVLNLRKSFATSAKTLRKPAATYRRQRRLQLSPGVAKSAHNSREEARQRSGERAENLKNKSRSGTGNLLGSKESLYFNLRNNRKSTEEQAQRRIQEQLERTHRGPYEKTMTAVRINDRLQSRSKLRQVSSFEELGVSIRCSQAVMSNVLSELSYAKPSPIQVLALPALLATSEHINSLREMQSRRAVERKRLSCNEEGQSPIQDKHGKSVSKSEQGNVFLLAAETGSGKTLAYLMPIIDLLKSKECLVSGSTSYYDGQSLPEHQWKTNEDVTTKPDRIEMSQETDPAQSFLEQAVNETMQSSTAPPKEPPTESHVESSAVSSVETAAGPSLDLKSTSEANVLSESPAQSDRTYAESKETVAGKSGTNYYQRTSGGPRAIALVPNQELVDQTSAVAKAISHILKLKVASVSPSSSDKAINAALNGGKDLVVMTPYHLSSILVANSSKDGEESSEHVGKQESKKMIYSVPKALENIEFLIVDEADTMLDKSFSDTTQSVIDSVRNQLQALVFCAATIPRSLDRYLKEQFPNCRRLMSSKVHVVPRRITFKVIESKKDFHGNKFKALIDLLAQEKRLLRSKTAGASFESNRTSNANGAENDKTNSVFAVTSYTDAVKTPSNDTNIQGKELNTAGQKVMIFVNKSETVKSLVEQLSEETGLGAKISGLSQNAQRRKEVVAEFCNKKPAGLEILVCTDVASRGLDTKFVKVVILYDIPTTSQDLIHRIGRTGRFRRHGRAYLIVGKERRISSWITSTKRSIRSGLPLA